MAAPENEGLGEKPSPQARKVAFVLRPGEFDRSTSVWWAIPLAVGALLVLVGLSVTDWLDGGRLSADTTLDILVIGGITSIAWSLLVVLTQSEAATELGADSIDLRGRHRFWRARTVAWDLLAVSGAGTGLAVLLRLGPNHVLPLSDVPLVELSVLVLTVALLATFSRYAAMCFSTDAKGLAQKLEEIARLDAAARTSDRDQLRLSFKEQTDRIVAKSDEQIAATTAGLSEISTRLQNVANAIENQLRISEEAKQAAEKATRAQEETLAQIRETEEYRRAEGLRVARERRDRIAPSIQVKLHYEGTVFHNLFVDVRNNGFDGRGLRVNITAQTGGVWTFTDAGIASKTSKSFLVQGLGDLPISTSFTIGAEVSDVDGEVRAFRFGPIGYVRQTGFLGRTKGVLFNPPGWRDPA